METRSSPSVAVLHCLALTAGVPSFSTAPKPHLFHQLQEDFDMERLTRVYLREEKRQQTRDDVVCLEPRHKRTRSLSPPPPPPSRSAVNSSSSSSSASSSSASPSSSSPSSSCEEQTSAKKKKKAKREKPSKKAAAAKQPHTKLGEQQRRRVKSAHANTSSSLLNDDGGAVAKEEKKTKKHKQQQKTKKKKSAAISSPRALPPPPLEEEGHLLAPSSSSSSSSKLSTEKQPPLVDPVMLTELGPQDPKWTFTRPNGQKVVYGALSLADYMLCSGDFTEPHTRVPFGDGDLSEIDALVALHSKSVLLRQRRLQGGVGEGEVEGVVQRGSVLKAKQTPSLFEEGRFRRDALNGLERCAGEVVAEVVWVMEACGQQTQTQTGQFGGGQGHGQAEYDAYGNHTGTVGGGSGGSGGGGGSSSGDGGDGESEEGRVVAAVVGQKQQLVAVLAAGSVNLFAANSGAPEWQLSEFELFDALGAGQSKTSPSSLALSDLAPLGPSTLLVLGTVSSSVGSGGGDAPSSVAVMAFDLEEKSPPNPSHSSLLSPDPSVSIVSNLPPAMQKHLLNGHACVRVARAAKEHESGDKGLLFAALAEEGGTSLVLFSLHGLVGNTQPGGEALPASSATRWQRVSLLPLLLRFADASSAVAVEAVGAATPVPGSRGVVWVLSLSNGKSVAFALAAGANNEVSAVPVAVATSSSAASSSNSAMVSAFSTSTSTSSKPPFSAAFAPDLSSVFVSTTDTDEDNSARTSVRLVEVTAESVLAASASAASAVPLSPPSLAVEKATVEVLALAAAVVEEGSSFVVDEAVPSAVKLASASKSVLGPVVSSTSHCVESKGVKSKVSCRTLLSTQGHGVALVKLNPAATETATSTKPTVVWVRDEALASVVSAVFVARGGQKSEPTGSGDSDSSGAAAALLPSFSERLSRQQKELGGWLSDRLLGGSDVGTLAAESVFGKDGLTSAMRHKFGLDKVAVCLTRSGRLVSLSLTSGAVQWSTPASLLNLKLNTASTWSMKLVVTRAAVLPAWPEVAVIVSSASSSQVQVVLVDARNGQTSVSSNQALLPLSALHSVVPLPPRKETLGSTTKAAVAAAATQTVVDENGRAVLVAIGWDAANEVQACLLVDSETGRHALTSANTAKSNAFYFHTVDPKTSKLESRVVIPSSTLSNDDPRCFASAVVGSAFLVDQPNKQTPAAASSKSSDPLTPLPFVVALAYPSASDAVNSPAQILGDDSLLLKYKNKHLLAVMTHSPPGPGGAGSVQVSLVDTVAARVLHRVTHSFAQPPLSASGAQGSSSSSSALTLSENWVVYSYWNTKAKRSEVGVLSLYEGMVGPYDLNPLKVPLQTLEFSSLSAKGPVVMQRTFVFPKAVQSVSATVTAQGISTKNLLFVLESGQVVMVPRRMLDPRRPNTAPTKHEQAEGLMQYHPFLFLDPRHFVTMNETVTGLSSVFAVPAVIESATLVLLGGVDVFFTRATPSKTFDLLAADFNRPFLLALLFGLALMTVALKKLDREKKINAAWQ